MIGIRCVVSLLVIFYLVHFVLNLLSLTECVLNDKVLHLDLLGRLKQHVSDEELSVAHLADFAAGLFQ